MKPREDLPASDAARVAADAENAAGTSAKRGLSPLASRLTQSPPPNRSIKK